MNLKKCENGHYYDSDKYAECPRCGSREASSLKKTADVKPRNVVSQAALQESLPQETVPQESAVTLPMPKKKITGWLVCIKGELEGTVYELKSGKNTIGGTTDQDVVLAADAQVARGCQMVITYNPGTRSFAASAGTSRELSYVNGQVVLFNLEMHNRDLLQVGGETLLFIPLCGEDFAWDEAEE